MSGKLGGAEPPTAEPPATDAAFAEYEDYREGREPPAPDPPCAQNHASRRDFSDMTRTELFDCFSSALATGMARLPEGPPPDATPIPNLSAS
jgi:hypothetical protein